MAPSTTVNTTPMMSIVVCTPMVASMELMGLENTVSARPNRARNRPIMTPRLSGNHAEATYMPMAYRIPTPRPPQTPQVMYIKIGLRTKAETRMPKPNIIEPMKLVFLAPSFGSMLPPTVAPPQKSAIITFPIRAT